MDSIPMPPSLEGARVLVLPADQCVFLQGQDPEHYLLVSRGRVRVFARSEKGREVVLYRVGDGEMCMLTTACLLGHTRYPAEAVTETETEVRAVPAHEFERLVDEDPGFRRFVFEGLSARLAEVLQRLEALVLDDVHDRLAACLLQNAGPGNTVRATHEALATEVGTAREVVSRHLRAMEKEGLIAMRRGRIDILQRERLAPTG